MKSILNIKNLSHSFNAKEGQLFSNINLEVNEGDVIVLLGENGVGKTTLLKCIAGIINPQSGSISYNAKSIQDWNKKDLAKYLAYVSTQVTYSPMLKVWEFIAFGRYPFINWLGKLTTNDKEIIKTVMIACGVEHLFEKEMSSISDGERQKVTIARAIAQQTAVLILDEPTTHLDIKNSRTIFKLIKLQSEENKKTILISSHQVEQAIKIANKVWLFHENNIIECTPNEFKESSSLKEIIYGI